MSEQALAASPYKGLTPYSEDDASFFFGRQRERDMIEANLIATHDAAARHKARAHQAPASTAGRAARRAMTRFSKA